MAFSAKKKSLKKYRSTYLTVQHAKKIKTAIQLSICPLLFGQKSGSEKHKWLLQYIELSREGKNQHRIMLKLLPWKLPAFFLYTWFYLVMQILCGNEKSIFFSCVKPFSADVAKISWTKFAKEILNADNILAQTIYRVTGNECDF